MLAQALRCAVSGAPVITPAMAEAAQLRHWCRSDAQRLALAVGVGIYPALEAARELATTLAWHAERARIRSVGCRALAVAMLEDAEALRGDTAWRIKRAVAPMIAAHQRSGAILAEAHGVNGADGFPLSEDEVTAIVRREVWFSMPRGRHAG